MNKENGPGFDVAGLMPMSVLSASQIEQLADLQKAAFATTPEQPWSSESLQSMAALPTNWCQIAFVEEQPIGFVIASMIGGEAEILTIGVFPAHRKKGIGNALLRRFLSESAAHNVDTVFLEVRETNAAAIQLYGSLGFVPIGVRPLYYHLEGGKREDALLFKYTLK